jgi:CDP-paratose 2-epimerase
MRRRFLITGGCGFLGSNIAERLLRDVGTDLVVVDNLSRVGSTRNLEWLRSLGQLRFIHGDTRNTSDVDAIVSKEQPEVIFHLAGQVAMTTSLSNPRLDFETNGLGTLNILEAVRRFVPGAAVIYSSTNKVYGDLENLAYEEKESRYVLRDYPLGVPENIGLDFHSPYGCSKGTADQYMLDYARMFGLNTAVFRHSSMYGSRQFATYDQGWIGWFCQQVLEQAKDASLPPFTVSGSGKQVRDVLHAEDMVDAYLSAARRIDVVRGQAFNIGGGPENCLSVVELIRFLGLEMSVVPRIESIAVRQSDQRVFVADIRKATNLLRWRPRVGWQDGIRRMIEWVASNVGN